MNILFIEDEPDLQSSGVLQLESRGHKVYASNDLEESREILSCDTAKIDLIISDHRLPDGLGTQFLIEIRQQFPACRMAIVSGCLSSDDIETLKEHEIAYFLKPLLYTQVIDRMRKKPAAGTPVYVPPPEPELENDPETSPFVEAPKKKSFGYWPKGRA